MASKRAVEYNEAKSYAEENNLLFMETSAKTAVNVVEVFSAIATRLPRNESDSNNAGQRNSSGVVKPSDKDQTKEKSGCCK